MLKCSLLAATSQFSALKFILIYLGDCVFTLNDHVFVFIECTLMLMYCIRVIDMLNCYAFTINAIDCQEVVLIATS